MDTARTIFVYKAYNFGKGVDNRRKIRFLHFVGFRSFVKLVNRTKSFLQGISAARFRVTVELIV